MNTVFARLAALLAAALLAGCTAQAATDTDSAAGEDRLTVVASFSLLEHFVRQVGGERVEVSALVQAGAEPHDWEPGTQDLVRLESADVLILNGAGFEHWVDGLLPALQNDALVVADTSAGLQLLPAGHGDEGDHGHDDDVDHDDEDDHDDGDGHDHGEWDPHVWLDPLRAAGQLEAIRDALTAADPAGADLYAANCRAATEDMRQLDGEFRAALDPLPRRDIVVAHAAFGYLCDAYGLTQVPVQGLSPEGEPDPAQMAQVIRYAGEHGVRTIFFEDLASPAVAEAIARETGAETAVLHTLESVGAGEDYRTLMLQNLRQLEIALA